MIDLTNPEEITYLYQIEEFRRLGALNHHVGYCYNVWRKKDITLEHAIALSVKLLAEACYIVQRPLPASSLVFLGKHVDFIKYIYEARSIPDLIKIRLLSDCLHELSKLALVYHERDMDRFVLEIKANFLQKSKQTAPEG